MEHINDQMARIRRTYQHEESAAERRALYWEIGDVNAFYCDKPLLFFVAGMGDADTVQWMLEEGADVGWRSSGGRNVLYMAAEGNHKNPYKDADFYRTASLLLAAGASALRKDADGSTALHIAAQAGNLGVVQALCEVGKKLDFTDMDGNTALHIACKRAARDAQSFYTYTKPQYEKELAKPPPQSDMDKRFRAAEFGPVEARYLREMQGMEDNFAIVKLLAGAGLDPRQKNERDETAADLAADCDDLRVAALLNGSYTDEEGGDALRMRTRGLDLYSAVGRRQYDALRALLELGEGPDSPCGENKSEDGVALFGKTPLGIACSLLDIEAAEILLAGGADPAVRDEHGKTALAWCFEVTASLRTSARTFEDRVVERLVDGMVERGLDLNAPADNEGRCPMLLAAQGLRGARGYNSDTLPGRFIEVLVQRGTDVNRPGNDGTVPLLPVCHANSHWAEDVLVTLLEAGADVGAKDRLGTTALMCAAQNRDKALARTLAELLLDFGDALPRAVNNEGKTALDYAVEQDNEALVNVLLQQQ